ncbi:MAG: hypothetical protein KDD70_09315 [Bdellovibrionales bacterium]|nr:hypothetical protein [Bdellovibrionales bacterium]
MKIRRLLVLSSLFSLFIHGHTLAQRYSAVQVEFPESCHSFLPSLASEDGRVFGMCAPKPFAGTSRNYVGIWTPEQFVEIPDLQVFDIEQNVSGAFPNVSFDENDTIRTISSEVWNNGLKDYDPDYTYGRRFFLNEYVISTGELNKTFIGETSWGPLTVSGTPGISFWNLQPDGTYLALSDYGRTDAFIDDPFQPQIVRPDTTITHTTQYESVKLLGRNIRLLKNGLTYSRFSASPGQPDIAGRICDAESCEILPFQRFRGYVWESNKQGYLAGQLHRITDSSVADEAAVWIGNSSGELSGNSKYRYQWLGLPRNIPRAGVYSTTSLATDISSNYVAVGLGPKNEPLIWAPKGQGKSPTNWRPRHLWRYIRKVTPVGIRKAYLGILRINDCGHILAINYYQKNDGQNLVFLLTPDKLTCQRH